jgi:hypothetical protein
MSILLSGRQMTLSSVVDAFTSLVRQLQYTFD